MFATAPSGRRPGRPLAIADTAWFEASLGFAILTPLLFVPQLTTVGVALAFGALAVYAWAHRRDAVAALARRWPLLLIPGFALASTIWSGYPSLTLKHALELSMTITGALLLSASRRPAHLLLGGALAFGLYLVASFVFGHSVTVNIATVESALGTSFTGLNGGKNLLGMSAAIGALTSVFALCWSLRRRWAPGVALAAAMIGLEVFLVYKARSAGATIGLVLAVAAFAITASLGLIRRRRRPIVCGALVVGLGAGGVFGYAFANSVTAKILDLFHKDPTLTGRSYLWYRAADFIRERPLLGRGFEAFWVQGNLDAEGLWQYAQVTDRMGFNFHNTPIELLVHFGWIGAILISAIFAYACLRLLQRAMAEPSLVAAFYVALITFQVARMPFESLMPSSVDFGTLLTFVALGFGLQPLPPRPSLAQAPRKPYRSARAVRAGPALAPWRVLSSVSGK